MNPQSRERIYWRCQVIGWVLYAAIGFVFIVISPPGPALWRFALVYAAAAVVAIVISDRYRRWLQRRRWTLIAPLPLLPRIIAASTVLGTLITGLITLLYFPAFPRSFLVGGGYSWVFPALYAWIFAMFFWNVLYFGQHYFEQYRTAEIASLRLAVAAKESDLRALETQLNPHFVFNCLNSLRALISEDAARAQTVVTELASVLRYTLTAGRRTTVPLSEELEAVEAYLKLEGIRLEERLQVDWRVDAGALSATMPTMLLQTLVENAVKHGIATQPHGGVLRIAAHLNTDCLTLEVSNPGQLADASTSTRIGLDNARSRLRLLYDGAAELTLANSGSDTVTARASVPHQKAHSA